MLQLFALASDIYHSVTGSIILVVSPLIALIADQISALTKRGISAASITPDMDSDSISEINEGKYSMVFLSPELLVGDGGSFLRYQCTRRS